ncbi:LuxR C-terminal-related transcriptional regulator [Cellulomonas sp. ATA003]|uniref:LuxR C-terminal-related transcriptional regulator n=1 Tax=Cellulomonas sp. ATA003 TaxID=3073064 RepID=UPI0037BEAF95
MTRADDPGYVRLLLDEGAPVLALLRALAARADAPAHTRRILAAARPTTPTGAPTRALVDPLSAREIDVVRLLASDLDGPDIARTLVVSVNTVRTHTKSIYTKLGVNSRRAAVRRAHELGLLTSAGAPGPR